jgi:lipoprotein-anchoring transpeptidase ErfK/SrfK
MVVSFYMREVLDLPKNNRNLLTTVAVTGALALSALAAENAEAASACPSPNQLGQVGLSDACKIELMQDLDQAGYDDVNPVLKVATYQKIANSGPVDGLLGPMTGKSILRGKAMSFKMPYKNVAGRKIVIDKKKQIALLSNKRGNKVKHVFSVSTGTEQHYREQLDDGRWKEGDAHTPTGNFPIFQEAGPDYKSTLGLGSMPWAQFFGHSGLYAVHGGNVDLNGRDSHGCVRVENTLMAQTVAPELHIGDRTIVKEKIKKSRFLK